jgi:hypothetical protein
VLRAGYNYGNNPMPEEFIVGNSLGTEHHITTGVGIRYGNWDFDFAYMYGVQTTVEFANIVSTSEQHWAFLGVSYQW